MRDWLRNHSAELIVGIVGIGISFGIALALTGDFGTATAGRGRT